MSTQDWALPEETSNPERDESSHALFEGDEGTLPAEARRVLTLLVRDVCVCALEAPQDYETIRLYRRELARELNNLGLTLTVSSRYEVAFAQQVQADDSGALMLKRAQPLSRDATILLVSIRARQHNDEANGEELWFVSREDLVELLASGPYANDRDGARLERSLKTALKQLCEAGYLKDMPAAPGRYRVMPLLPAVFTLERARELLESLTSATNQSKERP